MANRRGSLLVQPLVGANDPPPARDEGSETVARSWRWLHWSIGWVVAAEVVLVLTLKQLISPEFRRTLYAVHDFNCVVLALMACGALAHTLARRSPAGAAFTVRVSRGLYIVALALMFVHPILQLFEVTMPARMTLLTLGYHGPTAWLASKAQLFLALHKASGDVTVTLLALRGILAAAEHRRQGTPLIEWVAPSRPGGRLVNRIPVALQLLTVFAAILVMTTATGLHDAQQFVQLRADRLAFSSTMRLRANQLREAWPKLQRLQFDPRERASPPDEEAGMAEVLSSLRLIGPLGTPEAQRALDASRAALQAAPQHPAASLATANRELKRALDIQQRIVERWGNDLQAVYARDHDLIILALAPTVAMAAILAFLLARSVLTAVARARAMVRSVAQTGEDEEVKVEGDGEFAMLMRDIVEMRESVRRRERASAARQLQQRAELDELDRRQREAETAMQLETTARREAEAISNAKSEFLANVSHEIRTPLNGVLGMAQAMTQEPLSPAQRERLAVVQASGETLLNLLNDLLDISKIEAGKLELEHRPFEPSKAIQAACAAFQTIARKKKLSFTLSLDSALGVCSGDATRLGQVISNLASNAVKFTERGKIAVEARRQGDEIVVTVSDTGSGMPPESVERMFEKFVQADSSTTRRFGGSGLGLAICRDIVGLMGGTITGVSAPGEGSRFTVILPLPRIEGGVSAAEPKAEVAADGQGVRVLAAEDNPVNRLVLTTLLHQAGAEVTVVEDGAQAVEAWAAGYWDVILMDVQMPVLDGLEATAEIRRREAAEALVRTPIIALTANAMAHQITEYLRAGMDCVVAKPIKVQELLNAIAGVLEAEEAPAAAASAV